MSRRSKSQPRGESGPPVRSVPLASPSGEPFPPEIQRPNRWLSVAVCLLLALAVQVVFGQTLTFEFVNFDDNLYVYENPVAAQGISLKGIEWAFTHIVSYNWHPLTMMSHMLDCQLYGMNAGGHHLTNVLLHTTTAMLLFLVLRNLTGALWRSAFVAAVFALHPLRVESVAWVAERKDVLSGLFFMLTLWAYGRYAQGRSRAEGVDSAAGSRLWTCDYALVLLFFALGLMSKPMVVTLPFVLLLLDYWPLGRFSKFADGPEWFWIPRRLLLEKIPLLALAVAGCVVTLLAQREAMLIGEQLPFAARAGNALMSYTVYLGQMFYPAKLAPLYPFSKSTAPVWESLLALVFLAAVSGGVFAWRRKRPGLMVGWFWYLGMLVPVIGLVQVGGLAHADRYTYLPQIGLYLMATWLVADFCAGWRYCRLLLGGVMALVIVVLMVSSRLQAAYWRDSELLWTRTLACAPESSETHNNLGNALIDQGRLAEAIEHYERALQLNPFYGKAHNNLGIALVSQGKLAEAIEHYERALQLKPDYADAHINLGIALAAQGKLAEAIEHYRRALQLKPDDFKAQNNLGIALARQGKSAEAIEHFEQALQLKPDDFKARNNLGIVLAGEGKLAEAVQHFEQALQLNPDYADAHNNLGIALFNQGKPAEAVEHFQQALNLATAQGNTALAEAIRPWLKSCQAALSRPPTP